MNLDFDIHCHILPGIDDGSKDIEMSMSMIDEAYRQGVRYMIATPHYYPGYKNCDMSKVKSVYEDMRERVISKYSDFNLYLGNEIYYKAEVPKLLADGKINTMAGSRYVLLEFNVAKDYKDILYGVRNITRAGYYPILAHIERYNALWKRTDLVAELVETGAYMQINCENFTKKLFDSDRKYCVELIKSGLVHFLGTDCHNLTDRKPNIELANNYLKSKVDSKILSRISSNPQRILENKFI